MKKPNRDFHLNYKKLNDEDRRLLLIFWNEQEKWSRNASLEVTSLGIALFSLFVSSMTIIIVVNGITLMTKVITMIFGVSFVFYSFRYHKKVMKRLENHSSESYNNYREIGDIHFSYAKKQK